MKTEKFTEVREGAPRIEVLEAFKKNVFGNRWKAVDIVIDDDHIYSIEELAVLTNIRNSLRAMVDESIAVENAKKKGGK